MSSLKVHRAIRHLNRLVKQYPNLSRQLASLTSFSARVEKPFGTGPSIAFCQWHVGALLLASVVTPIHSL